MVENDSLKEQKTRNMQAVENLTSESRGVSEADLQCPCCGYYTYKESVSKCYGYICPVCFWENDKLVKTQDDISEANHGLTLMQARENYQKFGACTEEMISYVRPPFEEEKEYVEKCEEEISIMTMDETIKRINELYHKSQAEGLTEEEKAEQKELRQRYIESVRGNLRGQLENLSIQRPDGTIEKISKKK